MPVLPKYRLTAPADAFDIPGRPPQQAFVFMIAEHIADDSWIEFEGPERLVAQIRERVYRRYGFRARLIDEYVSPRDLACAMQGRLLSPYAPELISCQELFTQ
jgi:hypothetical protein